MIRISLLILGILACFLIFWVASRNTHKKLKLDVFCLTNIGLYFILLAGGYIFLADEKIGLFVAVASFGFVALRKYFYGRWI